MPWFNAQLESNGISSYMQVAKVEKSGIGLRLSNVRIQTPTGSTISLNEVRLSPAWLRIIRGTPALHMKGNVRDATFALNVSKQDDAIWLHDVDIWAQAGIIRNYIPQTAILSLTGNAIISGEIELRQRNGFPLAGKLNLQWKKAASGLLGGDPLGDFQLHLASSEKNTWWWKIKGGKMLSLIGNGHLSTTAQNPALWKVDGNIHVQSQGRVASLLSGTTGRDHGDLILSGNLSQPQLNFP